MDLDALEALVRDALGRARSTLGTIEEHVVDHGERPELMEASRHYARFCMAAREFLTGRQMHRPRPRRLAEQVREVRDALAGLPGPLDPVEARPTVEELDALAGAAESVPQRA